MIPDRPAVSIVIPVRDRPAELGRAVRSCLQPDCPAEIVVVDDGSADDPRAVLEREFPDRLNRDIFLIRQENQGACAARNAGLALARGEFIKFLDSDDELLPGALAREVAAAREAGCDALLTAWEERTFDEEDREDASRRKLRPAPDLSGGIDDMLLGVAPCVHAALYRAEFIRPLRWDPAWTKAQDWGWALTVCLAGARFASLDLPSCVYNHHPGTRITRGGDVVLRSTRARRQMLHMVERELRAQEALTAERRRRLAQYYYRDAQVLARHDPAEWRRTWAHCRELVPGFRPAEPNRILRAFSRLAGVYFGVRLYVALKPLWPAPRPR